MAILVNAVTTALEENPQNAVAKALKLLGVSKEAVVASGIAKTSLDARKHSNIHFVHSVFLRLADGEEQVVQRAHNSQILLRQEKPLAVTMGSQPLQHRPVIAGFGPAGMFAGLLLARYGYRPILLERGAPMEERVCKVSAFWEKGRLDEQTNVQFGEGGAGTFSDGKLTTRIGDEKCGWVLQEFVRFGAPAEILQKAKPHIGTDRLREVVCNIRKEICALGGEVRFHTTLTNLKLRNGRLTGVATSQGELPANILILATGHSARDTFETLAQQLSIEAKPFSVGVRIEHLQCEIDRGLYGALAGHPALPVGEYQLSKRVNGRGVYTFCMCPGGVVVPAASQSGMVVTNGMSCYARDGENANAALVVGVSPTDYGTAPLDGVRFQQWLEQAAFQAGGSSYRAPAQDVAHFLQGKAGLRIGRVKPTYSLGVEPCNFHALFPPYIAEMLRIGLQDFQRKLPGFAAPDTVLTGIETRTSSPIRILRGDNLQSADAQGVYPCAEGAGYAGGIMSAAVDGLRVALAVIAEYSPYCNTS